MLLAVVSGCSSIEVTQLPGAEGLPLVGTAGGVAEQQYRIRPGDDLDIKFFYTRELNETASVRPDGFITLQLLDDVKVAGLTPDELDEELTSRYRPYIKKPNVSVMVRSFKGFRAYVGGQVAVPQVVPLEGGMSVLQAIYRAGGNLPTAYMDSIILIRKGDDGKPQPYHLNLSDQAVEQGLPDLQVALSPSDVIYVPRSPIANANLWVQQYITDLVLFKGVQLGFGVNYVIEENDDDDD
ncbi:MAG: polysaccharide biosynthesis/export family protein [Pseudomonas sp.]|uniref:polysaccharide biosynthesis/export family protein n=1 Tax=Pseudomonas sp. TaxID=306 RepID=UPI0033933B5F